MDWINYHHLLYFWVVAREGSIVRACEELQLSQPTISGQLAKFEKSLRCKLFRRVGRGSELTEEGRMLFRYADEIFTIGREMVEAMKGRATGRPLRFTVGVADVLPKLVVYRLLEPACRLDKPIELVCHEGKLDSLLADLALFNLDVVLSEAPASAQRASGRSTTCWDRATCRSTGRPNWPTAIGADFRSRYPTRRGCCPPPAPLCDETWNGGSSRSTCGRKSSASSRTAGYESIWPSGDGPVSRSHGDRRRNPSPVPGGAPGTD